LKTTPRRPASRRARITGAPESLASPTQVTPERAASTAPHAAETYRSSALIRSLREAVTRRSHAKKSPSTGSRKPRIAVNSRCV
jgi:hypothetical protein